VEKMKHLLTVKMIFLEAEYIKVSVKVAEFFVSLSFDQNLATET
jgi:hypothetical protein